MGCLSRDNDLAWEKATCSSRCHHEGDLALLILPYNLNLFASTGIPCSVRGWEVVDASLISIYDQFRWCSVSPDRLGNPNSHISSKLGPVIRC